MAIQVDQKKGLLAMDNLGYLRIALIILLAITAYGLLLKWQEDYIDSDVTSSNLSDQAIHSEKKQVVSTSTSTIESSKLPADLQNFSEDLPSIVPQVNSIPEMDSELINFEKKIQVDTDVFQTEIDLSGGDLKKISLLKYPKSLDKKEAFVLLEDSGLKSYIAQSGILGRSGRDFDQSVRPVYTSNQREYSLKGDVLEVPLSLETNQLSVVKLFRFYRGEYKIEVEYQIINKTNTLWQGNPFYQIKRDRSADPSAQDMGFALPTYLGMAYWDVEKKYNKLDFDDIDDAAQNNRFALDKDIPGGWVALVQHYFLSAWIAPAEPGKIYRYNARSTKDGQYIIGFTAEPVSIPPQERVVFSTQFYAGPKIEKNLKNLSDGLNLAIDYGFLFFISHFLFQLLSWINGFVGNWGWSIVLLTCLVKLFFYYPSALSYRSMARMRVLQPELMRLKDLYGNDKQKMSQEMIKLYQKEKVNPFGGCLPVLLQMPVFIALYWALLESVELRQAPFMGWVQDLSVMDPYFVLPLLMGASMYVQTLLNPSPPDPVQAKVMKFMPVIFTVFFLFFPSGLVLYWLTNNILSILQQWFITREVERANIKRA